MKKLFAGLVAATLAISMVPATAFAADITVTANGDKVAYTDAAPYINSDNRTLVPLRAIAEALNLKVDWNDEAKTATFATEDGAKKVDFTIGAKELKVTEGEKASTVEMDTAAVITNDRTYAPARYLAEAFGYNVSWDGRDSLVSITPSYEYTSTEVEIPSVRSTKIPATVVMPKVAEGIKVPLVAIAHGHGGNREENGGLTSLAESLAKAGIASVRMDFPGCGKSEESFQANTMTNMVNDVYSSIEYVEANFAIDSAKVGVFGYSMGGRIAATVATEGKVDFKGLVMLAPFAGKVDYVDFMGDKATYDELYAKASKDGYVVFTTKYGQVQELSKAWFDDIVNADPLKDAGKYTGKALVIYGQDDDTVAPKMSQEVADAFHADVVYANGGAHSYSFYTDITEIKDVIEVNTVNTFLEAFK